MKSKYFFKLMLTLSLLIFVFTSWIYAGTTGKIAGIVKDKDSGEPLPGVAIQIEGTTMGAAANEKGEYFILNVPPGFYKLKVSLIGYAPVEVENVQVSLDLTTTIDVQMTAEAVEVKGVTVTAERPIFEPDLTSTAHIVTSVDIVHRPVINTDGIVYRTPGVVFDPIGGPINQGTQGTVIGNEGDRSENSANPGITLRGGRPQEVVYMVDGLSITDPILAGQATNLNHFTIAEAQLITSGFNAEYGNAMSGIINYVTQEGGGKLSGRYQYSTDAVFGLLGGKAEENYDFGTNEHFLSLSGPVPGTQDKLFYYFGGNLYLTEDWGPRLHKLPHHDQQTYRTQGKLTYKLNPNITLRAGGFLNRRQYERYDHSWLYNLAGFDCTLEKAKQAYVSMTHNVSKRTFYELRLGYFKNEYTIGRRLDRSLLERAAGERTATAEDSINFVKEHEDEIWDGQWWKDYEFAVPTPDTSVWNRYIERIKKQNYPLAVHNLFWSAYDNRNYQTRSSDIVTGKIDLTSQVNFHNEVKAGLEFNSYKITRHYNSLPWDAQPFIDIYEYTPLGGAFYVQDKIEYQGLIVNVGGRVDYLSKDAKAWDNELVVPDRPDLEPDGGRTKEVEDNFTFSPRLGISHPISDKMTIFFNYGHFTQQPRFLELYTSLAPNLQRANQQVGNPELKPSRNIQYELGLNRAITRDLKLSITAYYKDVYNMTQFERIFIVPQPYDVYKNLDYANIKGLEVTLSQRPRKYLSFDISYVLQYAQGTNSDAADQYEYHSRDATDPVTGLPRIFPQTVNPLDFDQRHDIVVQADLRFPKEFSLVPLRQFGINVVSEAGSGLPYTKRDYKGNRIGTTNQYRKPWTFNTDLTLDKSFTLWDKEINFFVQVFNLFDRINILDVYPATGQPDNDGYQLTQEQVVDPQEDSNNKYWDWIKVKDTNGDGVISREEQYVAYKAVYALYVKDPMNYSAPRQIKIGFYIAF